MSNYEEFYLMLRDETGNLITVAGADVIIYDVDSAADLDTVTTDADGLIAAGTVAAPAGSRIRFRVENYNGLAGSATQITT